MGTDDNAFYLAHDFAGDKNSAGCPFMDKDTQIWDFRIRNHADMESYNTWMEQLQGWALYYAEPDHAPTSIITFATCDRRIFGKSGRFLVIAGRKVM